MQSSEKDANATFETLPGQWPSQVLCHLQSKAIAKYDKRQPVPSEHNRSIFPTHTSNGNLENKRNAHWVYFLRPLERTLRGTGLPFEREWQTICKWVTRN